MKRKRLIISIVCVAICMIATVLIKWKEKSPYDGLFREAARIEAAIGDEHKKVAEGTSLSPLIYSDPSGNKIVVHRFVVVFEGDDLNEEEKDSLAYSLSGVVDPEADEKESCKVNDKAAMLYTKDEQKFLCWRLCPNLAYIIEYTAGAVSDGDIMRMAESVEETPAEE